MDLSTICPVCLHENVYRDGYCQFCNKKISLNYPAGILPPGYLLHDRYFLGMNLGHGGFGTIYKALDLYSGQTVAVKEYYPTSWCYRAMGSSKLEAISEDYQYGLKHFYGESEILRSLQHIPEVVRLYDAFSANNTGYYVMEYLHGETMQSYVRRYGGKISFSAAVEKLMPAILGLRQVHLTGTLHRDISPDNIFLCSDGSVRVIDFGASAAQSSKFAQSFIPVEKEGYSPPEQHTLSSAGASQGAWSDVYAMAGTLYRCTVGERPPTASARQTGEELNFSRSGLTPAQIQVLSKNLSLRYEERSRDMLRFARELLSTLKDSEAEAIAARYPELRSKPSGQPPADPPTATQAAPQAAQAASQAAQSALTKRRVFAYVIDLFFFQLVPVAIWALTAGPLWLWLLLGLLVGFLTTALMTLSDNGGGPGEVLLGLEVSSHGRKPERSDIILYCMLRIFWPLEAVKGVYSLVTHKDLNESISGCRPRLKGAAGQSAAGRQLMLVITAGFFQGSSMPLKPGRYVFGRNPEQCNLVFPMTYNVVSRVHVEIIVDAANQIFVTSRSGVGTWVNNKRLNINETVMAKADSTIAFGKEQMVISYQ